MKVLILFPGTAALIPFCIGRFQKLKEYLESKNIDMSEWKYSGLSSAIIADLYFSLDMTINDLIKSFDETNNIMKKYEKKYKQKFSKMMSENETNLEKLQSKIQNELEQDDDLMINNNNDINKLMEPLEKILRKLTNKKDALEKINKKIIIGVGKQSGFGKVKPHIISNFKSIDDFVDVALTSMYILPKNGKLYRYCASRKFYGGDGFYAFGVYAEPSENYDIKIYVNLPKTSSDEYNVKIEDWLPDPEKAVENIERLYNEGYNSFDINKVKEVYKIIKNQTSNDIVINI